MSAHLDNSEHLLRDVAMACEAANKSTRRARQVMKRIHNLNERTALHMRKLKQNLDHLKD